MHTYQKITDTNAAAGKVIHFRMKNVIYLKPYLSRIQQQNKLFTISNINIDKVNCKSYLSNLQYIDNWPSVTPS